MKPSDIKNAAEIVRLIQLLTAEESDIVAIHCDNADINGLPDCLVTSLGIQTEDLSSPISVFNEFRNDSVLECLQEAVIWRRRLVICGEFIALDEVEDDAEFCMENFRRWGMFREPEIMF